MTLAEITTTPQLDEPQAVTAPTRPVILRIDSDADRFDILDPFHRVFWKDMDEQSTLSAMRDLGAQYFVVPTTGRDHGERVPRTEWGI